MSEERLRIARDLHDAVAHQISVISLNANVASSALDARPEKAREALATIRGASRVVLSEIGDLLAMLRAHDPSGPEDAQPSRSLDYLDELIAQFRAGGLAVSVHAEGNPSVLSAAVSRVAYRVIQEALTNAHKHGAEHRAHVRLDGEDDRLRIVVTNPMDPSAKGVPAGGSARNGFGLLGLRERVASVRGTIDAGPTPGGYRVAVALPLTREGTP